MSARRDWSISPAGIARLLVVIAVTLLLAGCDALGGGDAAPTIDGRYDLEAEIDANAGEFRYDGEIVLAQDGHSFSGGGEVDITLSGEPTGTRTVKKVRGTYNHPDLTLIWDMEDPNEPNPNQARRVWSIDATVSSRADSIDGLIEVPQVGGGGITLVEQ